MVLNSLIYGGIAGAATLLGILVVMWQRDIAVKYSHYINSFAAGALITIALTHLVPESIELASNALLGVLLSFLAFYLLETALVFHSGSEIHYERGERHSKAPVLFSGLFLHSLIDGFIIAVGFEVSTELGLFAASGVILHELPEGVTSFALLLRSMSRKTALRLSIAVALATPVGALIALGPLSAITETGLGMMMAVAAGSFLYVAASDLIPETHEKNAISNAIFLLIGAGLMYFLSTLFK
jgi:ZIP family zinc transporter/zinc and cadmium transporter